MDKACAVMGLLPRAEPQELASTGYSVVGCNDTVSALVATDRLAAIVEPRERLRVAIRATRRFGSFLPLGRTSATRDALSVFVDEKRDAIETALARLEGRRELVITLPVADPPGRPEASCRAANGRTWLKQAAERRNRHAGCVELARRNLLRVQSCAGVEGCATAMTECAQADRVLVDLSVLVPSASAARLRRRLREATQRLTGLGEARPSVSGPWPCFTFGQRFLCTEGLPTDGAAKA